VDRVAHTFVFADLAGFTALTEAHGDERAADLAAEFYGRIGALLEECGGQEIKQLGDAVMLRVDDATTAVDLAVRVVEEASRRHGTLGVRVGMHTGPAVERGGDWFGASVNVAARVAARAERGEVLLTAATREAVGAALDDRTVLRRGAQRLKNVGEPVELCAVIVDPDRADGGLPLDPVCRMAVDPARSEHRTVHRGVEYHFCSAGCWDSFREHPARYVNRQHRGGDVLVSDRARFQVAARLGREYERGRLTDAELEERLERALVARRRADLRDVTSDLPRQRRRVGPLRGTWLFLLWVGRRPRSWRRRLLRRREARRLLR
jgi:class 3 adenylate cyclase/YHS domain-containing protein